MACDWLQTFDPCADELFDVLAPQIDDGMLRQIAAADYGQDTDRHLRPLQAFRDQRIVPTLDWHPREVLELIRWSEPEREGWRPGAEGRPGHLMRAFACATLLRSYALPRNEGSWYSFNETAIQFVDSVRALGGNIVGPAVRFLAWSVWHLGPLDREGTDRPFLGLGLLLLCTSLPDRPQAAAIDLSRWIESEVASLLRDQRGETTSDGGWLLSLNHHDMRNDRWLALGHSLRQWAQSGSPSNETEWVARIGRSLVEG